MQLFFAIDAFENLISLFEVFVTVVCINPINLVVAFFGTAFHFFGLVFRRANLTKEPVLFPMVVVNH